MFDDTLQWTTDLGDTYKFSAGEFADHHRERTVEVLRAGTPSSSITIGYRGDKLKSFSFTVQSGQEEEPLLHTDLMPFLTSETPTGQTPEDIKQTLESFVGVYASLKQASMRRYCATEAISEATKYLSGEHRGKYRQLFGGGKELSIERSKVPRGDSGTTITLTTGATQLYSPDGNVQTKHINIFVGAGRKQAMLQVPRSGGDEEQINIGIALEPGSGTAGAPTVMKPRSDHIVTLELIEQIAAQLGEAGQAYRSKHRLREIGGKLLSFLGVSYSF